MNTEKKLPGRRSRSPEPIAAPPSCATCDGTGETKTTVRVGRKRREIGATQTGLCPTCIGTGIGPA